MDDCELVDTDFYSVFRRDRGSSSSQKKKGGGVLIAVAIYLRPEPLVDFNSEAEDLCIALVIDSVKVFLSVLRLSSSGCRICVCIVCLQTRIK